MCWDTAVEAAVCAEHTGQFTAASLPIQLPAHRPGKGVEGVPGAWEPASAWEIGWNLVEDVPGAWVMEPRLLVLTWPSPSFCSHCMSKPADGRSLFLSVHLSISGFQIKKSLPKNN